MAKTTAERPLIVNGDSVIIINEWQKEGPRLKNMAERYIRVSVGRP